MSCYTCKNKTNVEVGESENANIFTRIFYFIIGVVIILAITPILSLIGIYMLFNTVILDKGTDIMPSFTFAAQLLNRTKLGRIEEDNEGDDEEDFEDINPDDYELIGVEEIKTKNG